MSEADDDIRPMSRRSFMWSAVACVACYAGYRAIGAAPQEGGVARPLRRVLEGNEKLARALASNRRLVQTFPRDQTEDLKVNGDIGMPDEFDPSAWTLKVTGLEGEPRELSLADLQALPRVEQVVEHKCVEGWSQVVAWGGARFSDFAARYRPSGQPQYVGMATPDGAYYVGLDIDGAMHPQTLLAWEMNGQPLDVDHGAPLRLVIPTRYGVKSIKRLGVVAFTTQRPADYWAENGYDWYCAF
jgi:DMSO/TMAO reductase YedYZ molybdopterin-dependent catalytic subunit